MCLNFEVAFFLFSAELAIIFLFTVSARTPIGHRITWVLSLLLLLYCLIHVS